MQDTGNLTLGGDVITVTFAGPRVIQADAEDITSWDLEVNATKLDLTGSVLSFDVPTQVLTMTLGPNANLHAAFTLAAVTTADLAATVFGLLGLLFLEFDVI